MIPIEAFDLISAQIKKNNITAQFPGAPCPEGWIGFKSYCYFASSSSKSWHQAQTYCKGLEGELVKINSAEENAFVLALVREVSPLREHFWIGLKWNSVVKNFLWSDNSVPSYTNWAPNEPNGKASEPCGSMWTRGRTHLPFQASGYWNDRPCGISVSPPCGLVCKRLP